MLIHTSPTGMVHEVPLSPPQPQSPLQLLPRSPVQAILYDFDIDGDRLKKAHRTWLEDNVVKPTLKDRHIDSKITLEGRASRSGPEGYNMELSRRRAMNALDYLESRLKTCSAKIYATWVGESLSLFDDNTELPIDRSVVVTVVPDAPSPGPVRKPEPPPKDKPLLPPVPVPDKKTFRLRILGSQSKAFSIPVPGPAWLPQPGVSENTVIFQICDVDQKKSGFYFVEFDGKTLGWGVSVKGASADMSFTGPTNEFQTPQDVSLKDFEGFAALDSYSLTYVVNSWSKNSLCIGHQSSWWRYPCRFRMELPDWSNHRTSGDRRDRIMGHDEASENRGRQLLLTKIWVKTAMRSLEPQRCQECNSVCFHCSGDTIPNSETL